LGTAALAYKNGLWDPFSGKNTSSRKVNLGSQRPTPDRTGNILEKADFTNALPPDVT
jgi:hypothetical protein